MQKSPFVPTPRQCQRIVRVRRLGLCESARLQYEADPLLRWFINSLWVIGTVDGVNGRQPFAAGAPETVSRRGSARSHRAGEARWPQPQTRRYIAS